MNQLLEQNSQLKLEVCIADKKLAARNDRIKGLEQQIFEREQLQTREELDFRFKIARQVKKKLLSECLFNYL